MVVIRLSRRGAIHSPRYRVTVADSRRSASKKYIEVVGRYNPLARGQEKKMELDLDKINEWIKKGAQPSNTVKSLMKRFEQEATN